MEELFVKLTESLVEAIAQEGNTGGRGGRRIEEIMYKRLETFRGPDWKDWSYQMKTVTAGANKELVEVLEKTERMQEYDETEVLKEMSVDDEERVKTRLQQRNLVGRHSRREEQRELCTGG